ncbi:MAG: outer membrane protein assembly factor BamA [Bdellovibrio sp.]|nr:MAG: outer membrane protein assembly factor BamA [Bdellovibrio sp.]
MCYKYLKPLKKIYFLGGWMASLVVFVFFPFQSAGAEDFSSPKSSLSRSPSALKVTQILIRGNKKIEKAALEKRLSTKVGEPFSLDKVKKDVRSLFDMGYFYDIQVDKKATAKGVQLTYTVVEKPSIVSVEYKGNDELDDDELAEASEIKAYEILNIARVQKAVDKMRKLYEEKGFFLAQIKPEIKPVKDGVKLVFRIQENDKVVVKKIRFIGNRLLGDTFLKTYMETKEGGFFSFISDSGSYKQDTFDRDVQRLQYIYFNEGFVQAKIDRPQVYVTPDKKGIFITIRIEEGSRFNIGQIHFTGDLLFPEEELREVIQIREGERFSYEKLQKDLRALQAKYGDLGYAFTNVIPRNQVNAKEKTVDIIYDIDKGEKVYIGKINIVGNTQTRDKVIRRELRIYEGELYNETRKRESEANVRRLGFFDQVSFNTKTTVDRPDIMDIDIVVKERPTGTIQLAAGYGSYQGFTISGQVSQPNFLGRGQRLSASLDISNKNKNYSLSFTDPYFRDTLWSVGFSLFQRDRILPEYKEFKKGASVQLGYPLAPYLRGYLSYSLDEADITLDPDTGDPDVFPEETVDGVTSALTASLIYDRRNDRLIPTDGIYSSLSLEYAGLGGDISYTKALASFRYYRKIFWDLVWRNNINYGVISPNKSGEELPFNQLFLLGGANSLRGFDWYTIGKRKFSNLAKQKAIQNGATGEEADLLAMVPYGGTQQFFYNLEFMFPLIREARISGVVFYDVGSAEDSLALSFLRHDVGFGFRWRSPIGPLRFEWGFPLDKKEEYGEKDFNFEFAIGSPF